MSTYFIIAGPSGSGKTTLLEALKKDFNLRETRSLTTRERRPSDTDACYGFVTVEEFLAANLVDRTTFDGHYYGTTAQDIENADIIVADVPGVQNIKSYLNTINRPCLVIGVTASPEVCAQRMRERGDGEAAIQQRLNNDAEAFMFLDSVADVMVTDFDMNHSYERIKKLVTNWR